MALPELSVQPKAARSPARVDGAALADAQAGDTATLGRLPADAIATALDRAGASGMQPAEWVARAIRAYANAAATAAYRKRVSRERKRMALEENRPEGESL